MMATKMARKAAPNDSRLDPELIGGLLPVDELPEPVVVPLPPDADPDPDPEEPDPEEPDPEELDPEEPELDPDPDPEPEELDEVASGEEPESVPVAEASIEIWELWMPPAPGDPEVSPPADPVG